MRRIGNGNVCPWHGFSTRADCTHGLKTRATVMLLVIIAGCAAPNVQPRAIASSPTQQSFDLITTYSIYAKSIWHSSTPGGYWGDGVDPKANQNGAVRGTCSTMLGYAMLAHAIETKQLDREQMHALEAAGLDRTMIVKYIRNNLRYVLAHHVASPNAVEPTWGQSWQSPLWLSSAGVASLLV